MPLRASAGSVHRVSDLPSRYVDPVFGLNGRSCQVEDFELVSADHGPLVVPADILDRPRNLKLRPAAAP